MNQLIPINHDPTGELLVDSRVIASQCNVEHESLIALVEKHLHTVEEHFGVVRFEIGKPRKGSKGGRPARVALLTENQATFLITLLRNTAPVVKFKAALVVAFQAARQQLSKGNVALEAALTTLATTVERTIVATDQRLSMMEKRLLRLEEKQEDTEPVPVTRRTRVSRQRDDDLSSLIFSFLYRSILIGEDPAPWEGTAEELEEQLTGPGTPGAEEAKNVFRLVPVTEALKAMNRVHPFNVWQRGPVHRRVWEVRAL